MARLVELLLLACVVVCRSEELRDFEFESDADEVMIAQESRHYQTIVKPPVRIFKPSGVTNSHRPQYNLDSLEHYDFEDSMPVNNVHPLRSLVKNYKSSGALRAKERMANEAVKRAIERKDHVGKFAQILPIIRAMSSSQRLALASLVANQVTTPPGRAPMNLAQVRFLSLKYLLHKVLFIDYVLKALKLSVTQLSDCFLITYRFSRFKILSGIRENKILIW